MLRALIVEDEEPSRNRLRRLLGRHTGMVRVVGEAESGQSAVQRIQRLAPDLVFLDVTLPGISGLDVLHRIPGDIHVVFTTASDQHAVEAFHARAVHYLLKPVSPSDLAEAIQRVVSARSSSASAGSERRRPGLHKLLCRDRDTTFVIDPKEVLFFKSESGYTMVRTAEREYLTTDSLSSIEENVGREFVRIHRNAMVNIGQIERLRHVDGEVQLILRDGTTLPVSRRNAQRLRQYLMYGADQH